MKNKPINANIGLIKAKNTDEPSAPYKDSFEALEGSLKDIKIKNEIPPAPLKDSFEECEDIKFKNKEPSASGKDSSERLREKPPSTDTSKKMIKCQHCV